MFAVTKVHLQENFQRDSVSIYVLGGTPGRRLILRAWSGPSDAQTFRWDELDPNAAPTDIGPTLELPTDVLDAIVNARAQVRPADTSTTEALTDTRQTRDRLLALVETVIADQFTTTPRRPA